jgi:hypothetical protein
VVDAVYAALLGIGRYHTGIETSVSSRYQYSSLISALPFFGWALETLLARLPSRAGVRAALSTLLIAGALWSAARGWPTVARGWADGRGRNTRHTLFADPNPPAIGAIPGIPFLPTERARELVVLYHLH